MSNDKSDIPDGGRHDIAEDTSLDVPGLPGSWEWGTANHYHWNHKVNVYFGVGSGEAGGWLGEIDNFPTDDGERWTVHVRPILDDGTESGHPRETAETSDEHDTLAAAIDAVPGHIATHYSDE